MSAYGFDLNGFVSPATINTINLTTGEWTFLDFLPGGSAAIFPSGCAYDCFTDILYVVDSNGQLYSKNPALTGSFVAFGTPQTGAEFGLTFDSMNNKLLGCNFSVNDTFEVDRVTGVWTSIGPTLITNSPVNLAYDCFNDIVYGLALDFVFGTKFYRIYTVNPGPGVGAGQWTELGSTGLSGTGAEAGGLMWAPSPPADTTDTLYLTFTTSSPGQMYTISKVDGSATLLGSTNTPEPWAMFVTSPCCCVHEDSLVRMANGQQVKICELKAEDMVLDYAGRPLSIVRNVCTGRRNDFVKIPANSLGINEPKSDLLIQSGHPILYQGKEIACQDLPVSEKVETENRARIFTLITSERTFVNMEGVMVGTWSQDAFDNFVANDSSGRCLPLQ